MGCPYAPLGQYLLGVPYTGQPRLASQRPGTEAPVQCGTPADRPSVMLARRSAVWSGSFWEFILTVDHAVSSRPSLAMRWRGIGVPGRLPGIDRTAAPGLAGRFAGRAS